MNELTPDEHRILVDAIHDSATVIHKGQRMNERIRELAVKNAPAWMTDMGQLYPDIEKFAELIVRECLDIAQDRAAFDGFPPNDVNHIIDEIKEHFGVEE